MPVMERTYRFDEWFLVALGMALTVALVWMTLHLKNVVATGDAQDALGRLRFFVETQPVLKHGSGDLSLRGIDAIQKVWPDWNPGDLDGFEFSAAVSRTSYVIEARATTLFDSGCRVMIVQAANHRGIEFTDCAGSSGPFVNPSEYY